MKTILTAASFASIALLLASCSNEDNVILNDNLVNPDEIRFEAFANGMTRAENVFCNSNLPADFTIYAKTVNGVYINGDVITKEGNAWKNATQRYWPEGEVTFWGIKNGNFDWGTTTPQIKDFVVNTDAAKQVDLLYARTTASKTVAEGATAADAVKLNFRHALSQIVFQAKNTSSNINVTVKGIEVCNVYAGGTYTFPTENTNTNLEHPTPTDDVAANTRGTWATTDARATFGVTFTDVELPSGTGTAKSLTSANDNGKEYSSNALLMIPGAELTAWDKATSKTPTGTYFLIDVVITNKTKDATEVSQTLYNGKIAVAADFSTWKEGMKYVYTFDFNKDGNGGTTPEGDPVLYGITFTVEVDEFIPVDGTPNPIEL